MFLNFRQSNLILNSIIRVCNLQDNISSQSNLILAENTHLYIGTTALLMVYYVLGLH